MNLAQVLSINEEGLRRCEENTRVFGRPIRCMNIPSSMSLAANQVYTHLHI